MPGAHDPSSPELASLDTSAVDDGPHVLSAACPLYCLKDALSTQAFNALHRAIGGRYGGHPTVGHVLDMCQHRTLYAVRGVGVQSIERISAALKLAGLPCDVDHPASGVRLPSLAGVRAEHPDWRIERTRGRRTFGYTATSRTDPAKVIRTDTLSEMQSQLRQNPVVVPNGPRESTTNATDD
jgi:hypothetical protein